MPPDPPTNRDPDESRALAFQVYKEVWDEFNKWKQENCKQQLLLLQKPLPPPTAAEDALLEASNLRDGEPGEVEIIYLCDSEDDVPLHPGGSTVLMCETVHLEPPSDFTPHPRYESCTPAVQSILLRPSSAAEEAFTILPFVPYADDPTFDAKEYLEMHERFAWEELGDPDVEVIQFEALRRLYFGNGLSLDEIDATGVLPPLRLSNREGLIYSMTQRDELFWPGMTADFPIDIDGVEQGRIDPRAHEPDIDDLRGRLNSIFPYFCANPGCIQAFCPQHAWDFPPVPPTTPRVTSDDYPEGESCGSVCFREIDDTFGEDSVEWVESDVDELQCILEVIPDTPPCGLAILVYIQRQRLIPDDKVYPESAQALSSNKIVYNLARVHIPVHVTKTTRAVLAPRNLSTARAIADAILPANVAGRAVAARRYAQRICREAKPAPQRGVRAERKDGSATLRLGSILGAHLDDIQRGIVADVEIKRGTYGLGAFAAKRIFENQFIGEYVGELVPSDLDNREPLRDHVDLNYNFGYNPSFYLDSARVGNETRYINHGSGGKKGTANCVGETRLVFGEQRVGLWATRYIAKGEEILFNYGTNYWKSKKPGVLST
ncbi:hypothetical protein EDB89DRAFT_2077985 [Lactarius sanguifluus]|nr:hypothetical protein EDB89DRAFT_2077985 [Lactarius sanguifluus]